MHILEPVAKDVKKYRYEGDIENLSVEEVRNFFTEFKQGKLTPYLKSAPIPENNHGPVKIIVGNNWHDIVMDSKKDILVMYYAPWCAHC